MIVIWMDRYVPFQSLKTSAVGATKKMLACFNFNLLANCRTQRDGHILSLRSSKREPSKECDSDHNHVIKKK